MVDETVLTCIALHIFLLLEDGLDDKWEADMYLTFTEEEDDNASTNTMEE